MPTEDLKLVIENGILFINPWAVPDGGKFQEDGVKIDLRPLSRYEIIVVYGQLKARNCLCFTLAHSYLQSRTLDACCLGPTVLGHRNFQAGHLDASSMQLALLSDINSFFELQSFASVRS